MIPENTSQSYGIEGRRTSDVQHPRSGARAPSGIKAMCGFSLVEVNLAVLLVALGMLALFALFPAALREADSAITDTHEALFADYVLSGLEANASGMTNWNTWTNMTSFRSSVVVDIAPGGTAVDLTPGLKGPFSFAGTDLKYVLEVREPLPAKPQLRSAALWVWSGTYGVNAVDAFKSKSSFFYTEFYYPGVLQ